MSKGGQMQARQGFAGMLTASCDSTVLCRVMRLLDRWSEIVARDFVCLLKHMMLSIIHIESVCEHQYTNGTVTQLERTFSPTFPPTNGGIAIGVVA